MINKVTDYLYVTGLNVDRSHPHGDLDRIIIDGGILPLRANKRILRGEDLAFAAEAACERVRLINPSSTRTETFDRRVTATGISNSLSMATYADKRWIKKSYNFIAQVADTSKLFEDAYADSFIEYPGKSQQYSAPITNLRLDRLECVFYDLANTTRSFLGMYPAPLLERHIEILVDSPGIGGYSGEHYNPEPNGVDWGYQLLKWGLPALWELPEGSAVSRGTRDNVSISIPVANGGIIIAEFKVDNSFSKADTTGTIVDEEWTKYVWMPVKVYSSGTQFTLTNDELYAAAQMAFTTAGGTVVAYPGRSKGEMWVQEASVERLSTVVVTNLRDRTRWD